MFPEMQKRNQVTHDCGNESDSEGSGSSDESSSRSDTDETSEDTGTEGDGRVATSVDPENRIWSGLASRLTERA